MPNTFNLNNDEAEYISADVDDRKRISVGRDGAFVRDGEEYTPFKQEKPLEIDSPVTVVGPGHFTVEFLDAEPSAPAEKLVNPDGKKDVQEPSSVSKKAVKPKRKSRK
jgi:hypothetical protein